MQIQEANFLNGDVKIFKNDQRPQILFQCEHATNTLPHGLHWSENDTKHFLQTHWAIDLGALKLAEWLAERTNSVLVNSKYSRLYCDVNRHIQSESLCRKNGDGKVVELNTNLQMQELQARVEMHSSYHLALKLAIDQVNPKFIYSIHSFTPLYQGEIRKVEVGILTSHFDAFGLAHQAIIQQSGFNCLINEPYTGKDGLNFAIDSSCLSRSPPIPGTLFEVRQDILQDPIQFEKVANAILQSIIHVTENQ